MLLGHAAARKHELPAAAEVGRLVSSAAGVVADEAAALAVRLQVSLAVCRLVMAHESAKQAALELAVPCLMQLMQRDLPPGSAALVASAVADAVDPASNPAGCQLVAEQALQAGALEGMWVLAFEARRHSSLALALVHLTCGCACAAGWTISAAACRQLRALSSILDQLGC